MKVILHNRWNETLSFDWKGNIIDTLKYAQQYCIENDEIGYFFETKDANQDWLKNSNCPTFVNSYGDEVGLAEKYEIEDDNGNIQKITI